MPRRKIIGLAGRVGTIPTFPNNNLSNTVSQQSIIDAIQKIRIKAAQEALSKYNAADFQPIIIEQPNATYVAPIEQPVKGSTPKHTKYIGSQSKFANELYNSYYKAVRPGAASDVDADRQARFLTQKAAFETGYGSHLANTHNYGGHKTKKGWMSFNSIDDFTKRDVALLDKKWGNWRNSKNGAEFIDAINTNNGYGMYAPPSENTDYKGRYLGTTKRVNSLIDMGRRKLRCGGKVSRPKAFWGAVIPAVIGAASSMFGSYMQKESQEEAYDRQKIAEDKKYYSDMAKNLNEVLNNRDAQEAYENLFRVGYRTGGRRRLKQGVSITDGGYAIPMGQNTFLLRGGSHEDINESDQTGIGLNIGGKEIEAEGGEVVQKTPNEVRIFSKQPIINGVAPADAIKAGADKDKIFAIQQSLNGDYNGTNVRHRLKQMSGLIPRKQYASIMAFRNGGSISRPVERIKADNGIVIRNGRKYKRVRYPNSDKTYLQDIGPANGAVNTNTVTSNTNNRRNNTRQNNYNPGALLPSTRGIAFNNSSLSSFDPEGQLGRYWETVGTQNVEQPNNTEVDKVVNTGITPDVSPSRKNINIGRGRRSVASRGTIPVNGLTPRTLSTPIGPENYYPEDEILKEAYNGATLFEGAEGNNTSFDADDTVDTFVPVKERNNYNFDWSNLAGGIINGVGGLVSGLITNSALDKAYIPREPAPTMAVKLPTTYSIGADLAKNNRLTGRMLGDARRNTSSSAGLLSRRNLINLTSGDRANSLYQTKSRAEGEMLTRDALNQQQVDMFNAQRRDAYEQAKAQLEANRSIYKAYNWGNTIDKIVGAYNDYDAQVRQNKADDVAMNWYLSTLPDKDRNWFINQMRGSRNRVTFRR